VASRRDREKATGVFDVLELLFDVLFFGDWLEGIAAGDATEQASPSYGAPQMRRLRWMAWAVVLVYIAAVAAIPILAAASPTSDLWLSGASGGVAVTLIVLYVAAVCAGFVLLGRHFRGQRRLIAAQLANERSQ